jgi:hypothetical protein
MDGTKIPKHPIHLGLGATAVSAHTFKESWNEPGTWHSANVVGEATALFITAGMGTQHRPR